MKYLNDGRKFIILKKNDGINTLYVKNIFGTTFKTIEVKYNEKTDGSELPSFKDYANSLVQKYIYNKINNSSQAILENEKIKKFVEDSLVSSSKIKILF